MIIKRPNFLSKNSAKPKFQRTNFYPSNFARVDDFLLRSSHPSPEELRYLKNQEMLTDVVNLSDNAPNMALLQEEQALKELGINLHKIPSNTDKPAQENIELFLEKTVKLKKKPNSKMLVHCNAGVDRTGTFVLFYQLFNKLKSFDDAIKEMLKMGHCPEFHPRLLGEIKILAKKMQFIK